MCEFVTGTQTGRSAGQFRLPVVAKIDFEFREPNGFRQDLQIRSVTALCLVLCPKFTSLEPVGLCHPRAMLTVLSKQGGAGVGSLCLSPGLKPGVKAVAIPSHTIPIWKRNSSWWRLKLTVVMLARC